MALFDAPVKKQTLFRSYNVKPLDPGKETMVLVFSKLIFSKEQDHIIGWYRQMVKEVLAPRFNLVWIGVDNDPSRILDMGYSNIYTVHNTDFEAIKAAKFKRAKEMEEEDNSSWEHNRDVVFEHFHDELPHICPQYVMWLDERWAFLPLKDYWSKKSAPEQIRDGNAVNGGNEFHDYIGTDDDVKKFIHEVCAKVNTKYDYHVGILTFTYWMKNLLYNMGKWYIDEGVKAGTFKKSYYFVIDPGSYYRVFDGISPHHSNFAMAEDFRGTRDFEFFPVQEMQHFLYEKPWAVDQTKKRKFCFYGTIFLSKKTRKNLWDTYLRDLRGDNIDIYVPPKMDGHISERRKEGMSITRLQERVKDDGDIAELWESVSSHPQYKGYLDTQELNGVLAQYEYALIAKNIARYDSINFRPALYLALNVFPLLDYRYDPDCKGIPAEIQQKIVVHNHQEILDRIAYYDANPAEKELVMDQLKKHFNYYNFLQEWKDIICNSMKLSSEPVTKSTKQLA
jgi:hypothetical protein